MSLGGTTAFRSILDKPLNQLTEDDISQLTREDCRKYLKEKGFFFFNFFYWFNYYIELFIFLFTFFFKCGNFGGCELLTRVRTGMRRPSWNKSQAIQQVISLKALLEPSEDSGVGALRKIVASPPPNNQNPPRVAAISVCLCSSSSWVIRRGFWVDLTSKVRVIGSTRVWLCIETLLTGWPAFLLYEHGLLIFRIYSFSLFLGVLGYF